MGGREVWLTATRAERLFSISIKEIAPLRKVVASRLTDEGAYFGCFYG